tara:strand:+ start:2484 stop:3137 length:654 start_codon:yes stop_codon:yes gene_type:complete
MSSISHPSFYQISHYELAKLAQVKASGSVYAVYLALVGHGYGSKTEVWPSINRIHQLLNETMAHRTIERAMAFLEQHSFIKRKGSQTGRIKLLAKRAAAMVSAVVSTTDETDERTDETDGQRTERKKRNFFRKKGSRRNGSYRSKSSHRARESQSGPNDAEVLEKVCGGFLNGLYEHQSLTPDELNAMTQHRARSTDEWRHYQTHLPRFIQWAETHI